jgi:hypothetical protein
MPDDIKKISTDKETYAETTSETLPEKYLIRAVTIFAVAVLALYLFNFRTLSTDSAHWGQLGDFVGGLLNPLVSACTLYVALRVWKLQKKELRLTTDELKKASETADQQRRQQRFFDLLNLYQRTIDSNRYGNTASAVQGKFALEMWLKNGPLGVLQTFENQGFYPAAAMFGQTYPGLSKETLINAWNCSEKANFLDHYFRMIYRILYEAETLLGDDHIRYIKLLRAQLNRSELTVLAYNIWLDKEGIEMRPLAEKYKLLKHLAEGELKDEIIKEFPSTFF